MSAILKHPSSGKKPSTSDGQPQFGERVLSSLEEAPFFRKSLPVLAMSAMIVALWYVFTYVPSERVMGPVQRIFYFHVSGAFACYGALAALLFSSCLTLSTERPAWDSLSAAAASVGFLFASIVLATGMIWGHSAWNTWWRWEPRLVSFLVLWLILFGYGMFRELGAGTERVQRLSAVLGVLAAVNVPFVILSVKFLQASEQLHPQVVAQQGLKDPRFGIGLLIATVAQLLLCCWLIRSKYLVIELSRRVRELRSDVS